MLLSTLSPKQLMNDEESFLDAFVRVDIPPLGLGEEGGLALVESPVDLGGGLGSDLSSSLGVEHLGELSYGTEQS